MHRLFFLIAVVMGALGTIIFAQYPPSPTPAPIWSPNGHVAALARFGDTLYVGGAFDYVGLPTGRFVVAHPDGPVIGAPGLASGSILATPETVAAAPDGGWYFAGAWQHLAFLGGRPAPPIVKVDAQGAVDGVFRSPVFGGGSVATLAVVGDRLLVGGSFTSVDGDLSRRAIVALDPATGRVEPAPFSLNGTVHLLKVVDSTLFVGGQFTELGGVPRRNLAAIDVGTGGLMPFAPGAAEYANDVTAMGDRVYVTGHCLVPGVEWGRTFCALERSTGVLAASGEGSLASAGPIEAMGGRVFVGVEAVVSGTPRGRLLDVDPATLATARFAEATNSGRSLVSAFGLQDGRLYVGGAFTTIAGERRLRLATFDPATFELQPASLSASGPVSVMALAGGRMALAGGFESVGGVPRRGLVGLDLRSGRPIDGTPEPTPFQLFGDVTALTVAANVVVVAGRFNSLGPGSASGLAAFDARSGRVLPWIPAPLGDVIALASDGARVFVGGSFTDIAGEPRRFLAAFDLNTRALLPWNPSPNGPVTRLMVSSGALYGLGGFTTFPGVSRFSAAAFDLQSGALLPFDPGANGFVTSLAFFRDRILVGGSFTQLRRQSRRGLGWVDRISGEPLDLPPQSGPVATLARTGDTIVLGGVGDIDGRPRGGLGALAASSGGALPWNPQVTGGLFFRISVSEGYPDLVAVGGDFSMLNYAPSGSLAVFRTPTPGPPTRIRAIVRGSVATLAWTEGTEPSPTSYVVEVGSAPGLADLRTVSLGSTQASGSLGPGTYFARVRGVGTAGPGMASSEVVLTTPSGPEAPQAPSLLSAEVGGGAVTLHWRAAVGNAERYVIEAGTAPGLADIGVFDTGVLDTRFTTPAPPGTYYVRVRGASVNGTGPPSNELAVVVP